MPGITLKYNDARTSSATYTGNSYREIIVGGRATGISLPSVATAGTALAAVNAALAADGRLIGESTHPDDASMTLVGSVLRGVSGDAIDFQLRYTTFAGATPNSLIIDVQFGEKTVSRSYYPGSRRPIYVGWQGRKKKSSAGGDNLDPGQNGQTAPSTSNSAGDGPISPAIAPTLGRITFQQTIVRLVGTKVYYGSPNTESVVQAGSAAMVVNAATFLGRKRGAWKQTGYRSSSNVYGGTVAFSLAAESVGGTDYYEDQRRADVIVDPRTGFPAVVNQTKYDAAIAAPYAIDAITKDASGKTIYDPLVDGFVVVGPYAVADFDGIWSGILTSDTPLFRPWTVEGTDNPLI